MIKNFFKFLNNSRHKINVEIKRKFTTLKLILLGSPIPFGSQISWGFYHSIAKIFYFSKQIKTKASKQFSKNRYCDIGQINDTDLKELQNMISSILVKNDPLQSIPREKNYKLTKLIYSYIDYFSQEISSIFNSNYQVFWTDIYKTLPSLENNTDSSFSWHLDDCPKQFLKLFLYLDDTDKFNGAFRTFNKSSTQKLFINGFISNTSKDRTNSNKLITQKIANQSKWIERKAGSLFCFDNCLIHKATYPKERERTVIVVCLYPSIKPLKIENVHNSIRLNKKIYPAKPWENPYRHI